METTEQFILPYRRPVLADKKNSSEGFLPLFVEDFLT